MAETVPAVPTYRLTAPGLLRDDAPPPQYFFKLSLIDTTIQILPRYPMVTVDYMAPATLDPTRVLSPGPSPAAAFALPLPLENVGGVSVLRPSPRVPIVVGGRTLGSFGGGDGIAGVGGGISLRIGEDGRSGIFGSVFGAPVVGDFSIGTLFRLGGR